MSHNTDLGLSISVFESLNLTLEDVSKTSHGDKVTQASSPHVSKIGPNATCSQFELPLHGTSKCMQLSNISLGSKVSPGASVSSPSGNYFCARALYKYMNAGQQQVTDTLLNVHNLLHRVSCVKN